MSITTVDVITWDGCKMFGVGDRIAHKSDPEQEHNSHRLDFDYLVSYSTLQHCSAYPSVVYDTNAQEKERNKGQ